MSIEHIIPEAAGGSTQEDNLWLACFFCNSYKNDLLNTFDPVTGRLVPLFNPRTQQWSEHFVWTDDGLLIIGTTDIGRATVQALKLNRDGLIKDRRRWLRGGWKPPRY
jgi:hypothetical protein